MQSHINEYLTLVWERLSMEVVNMMKEPRGTEETAYYWQYRDPPLSYVWSLVMKQSTLWDLFFFPCPIIIECISIWSENRPLSIACSISNGRQSNLTICRHRSGGKKRRGVARWFDTATRKWFCTSLQVFKLAVVLVMQHFITLQLQYPVSNALILCLA